MQVHITKEKIVVVTTSCRVLVLYSIENARLTPGLLDYLLDNHLDALSDLGWLDNY